MEPRGFAYVDHTADVGIRAWGPTIDDAFAQAALGLSSAMVDLRAARTIGEVSLRVEAESLERLLFRFLDEILDATQRRLWIIARAQVHIDADRVLSATLEGEAYDAARHGHIHEVKAITFHELRVQREPPEVFVIVDV